MGVMRRWMILAAGAALAAGSCSSGAVALRDAAGGAGIDGAAGASTGGAGMDGAAGASMGGAGASGAADGGDAAPSACGTGCDPFVATSCPSGQICLPDPYQFVVTGCMTEASNPKAEGQPCDQQECGPTLGCLAGVDGEGFACRRLCPRGSSGYCGAGQHCGGDLGNACANFCTALAARCDILAQDCTSAADECTLAHNGDTGEYYPGCRPAGTLAEGEVCDGGDTVCAKGLVCAPFTGPGGGSICRRVCAPGGAACPTGQTCTGTAFSQLWSFSYCDAAT
jgi:hypothetical protein